tara:strand:- start:4725 stop:5465 length:741 start_codon:yes stop_codon:yes gene_type:complete
MESGEKFFKKSAVNYKYIPVSVFDVAKCGKTTIRGKQDHNKQSNRNTFSPFMEDVAEWCCEYYLRDTTFVFDPFAGWGERHKAVEQSGKLYLGYDISEKAIEYAKEKFNVVNVLGDSRIDEIPEHNGLLTCPPYWNLEKYHDKNGLDRLKKWDDFLTDYKIVWKRCVEKATPGSKYCIVLGDWRKNHVYYDLVFQTEKIMEDLGMKPFDKVVLSAKKQTKIKIMLPQAKRLGYSAKVHQMLLVYQK